MNNELDLIIVWAERYAIGRHTYASGETAQVIIDYAELWSDKTRHALIADIERAFKNHEVDELSANDWEIALQRLAAPPKQEVEQK